MQPKNHTAVSGLRGVHQVPSPSSSTPGMFRSNQAALAQGSNGAPLLGIHGFVSKKTDDPQALNLLVAASEYATAAMRRLIPDGAVTPPASPHLIDRYIDTVFGLEVHFVFPNLSQAERDLLVSIMKVRNSISAVLNGASRLGLAGEKAGVDELSAELNSKFLEFRSQIVESGIEQQLDPLQKKVFQDEFFSITLDKKCSTTLFFRSDAAPGAAAGAVQGRGGAGKSDPTSRQTMRASGSPAELGSDRGTAYHLPEMAPQLSDVTSCKAKPRIPGRKTVLLISSDPGARDVVGRTLRPGYNLLLAGAGFTGYATAMRERPDLVLVDLSLSTEVSGPNACLDGRGVLKMLSTLPADRALPFVALAPDGAAETGAQVLVSGAKASLQKPLDPRAVIEAVQNAEASLGLETNEAAGRPWALSASV